MADAVDSKSIVRKDVRVQLPPPAPFSRFFSSMKINLQKLEDAVII